jgi:hypothetical protein
VLSSTVLCDGLITVEPEGKKSCISNSVTIISYLKSNKDRSYLHKA